MITNIELDLIVPPEKTLIYSSIWVDYFSNVDYLKEAAKDFLVSVNANEQLTILETLDKDKQLVELLDYFNVLFLPKLFQEFTNSCEQLPNTIYKAEVFNALTSEHLGTLNTEGVFFNVLQYIYEEYLVSNEDFLYKVYLDEADNLVYLVIQGDLAYFSIISYEDNTRANNIEWPFINKQANNMLI